MRVCLSLLLLLLSTMIFADQGVLSQLQQKGSVEFSYQETRRLEFLSAPVHAQGKLFSSVDGSMVKLQLKPTRLIMVSTEDRLYYWDKDQNLRHNLSSADTGLTGATISLFRSLIQGKNDELEAIYNISKDREGRVFFSPRPGLNKKTIPEIEIFADESGQRVLIRHSDGESTEYHLVKTAEGAAVEKMIQALLDEAVGTD